MHIGPAKPQYVTHICIQLCALQPLLRHGTSWTLGFLKEMEVKMFTPEGCCEVTNRWCAWKWGPWGQALGLVFPLAHALLPPAQMAEPTFL